LARHFRRQASNIHDLDIFEDWKIHDVANTMANAARNIVARESRFFTLHATASDAALEAVARAAENRRVTPLAVTVLTDLDEPQCQSRFACSPKSAVVAFARNAWSFGIRGFVCSPLEAADIRDVLPDAYIVTPGIRPLWAVAPDEQKRVTTPTMAKRAGVNAIVVGRPIYQPPLSHTEASAAEDIRKELEAA
jgi:orotidine-5'-phosphate decarboxylase